MDEKSENKSENWVENESKIQHLEQLFEEGRYSRRFHHTIFKIGLTIYLGLAVLQARFMIQGSQPLTGNSILIWLFISAFLILIPLYLLYIFWSYHLTQGRIKEDILNFESEELKYPEKYLDHKKYKNFRSKDCWEKFTTGRGHLFFMATIVTLVGINIALFLL